LIDLIHYTYLLLFNNILLNLTKGAIKMQQAIERLVEAVRKIPKPPCEKNGICPHKENCSRNKLACNDFLGYVGITQKTGRIPSRYSYEMIYSTNDNNKMPESKRASALIESGLTPKFLRSVMQSNSGIEQAAEVLGIPSSAIKWMGKRYGIGKKDNPLPDNEKAVLLASYGLTPKVVEGAVKSANKAKKIALSLNVSVADIKWMAVRYGINKH
jgi:hypothetical protein